MAKYRKKPVVVEAAQWWKNGDHPSVEPLLGPVEAASRPCGVCGKALFKHGWVETLEGGHIVCPGDWIITGIKGEHYPCKPEIFVKTYEPVD